MGFPKPWVLTRVNIHKHFKKIVPVEAMAKKREALENIEANLSSENPFDEQTSQF